MKTQRRSPKIVAITNENPDWPDLDKAYGDEMWQQLLEAFSQEGYTFRAFKYFDDLRCLEGLDPREWLVWNWGEEWAGQAWSEAIVAEAIEQRGFAFTGSPPDVLRLTQDRMAVKQRLLAAGLPTLPARVFSKAQAAIGWEEFPAIVKGANQHSSVGIDRNAVVCSREQLAARIDYLRDTINDDALVEPFLDTREFQVAVWGNDPPEALSPSEIIFATFTEMRDRLHTQEWKMDRDSRGYQEIKMPCPAPLDRPDWQERLERIAVDAYCALGLRDYARFDLRMRGDEPQILDVNSNPDLAPSSVVLAGAMARGMNYARAVSQIIQFAAARMPR